MRSRATAATAVALLMVGGCASSPGSAGVSVSAFDSPTSAALSWFSAINHKDQHASLAHFETDAAPMAQWGDGPSSWPTFSSLDCKGASQTAGDAKVTCTFKESDAPSVGQPDTWWDIYLRQQSDGRWLIYSYGQG